MHKFIILLKKIYWTISKKLGFVLLVRDERKSIHSNKLKKWKKNLTESVPLSPKDE